MKTRLAAIILLVLLTLAALAAWVHTCWRSLVHADQRAKELLFSLDLFGNVGLFGGSRWESISSHTGRELRQSTWWAVCLSALLDLLQPGHCAGANAIEQPLLDVIKKFESQK